MATNKRFVFSSPSPSLYKPPCLYDNASGVFSTLELRARAVTYIVLLTRSPPARILFASISAFTLPISTPICTSLSLIPSAHLRSLLSVYFAPNVHQLPRAPPTHPRPPPHMFAFMSLSLFLCVRRRAALPEPRNSMCSQKCAVPWRCGGSEVDPTITSIAAASLSVSGSLISKT